MRLQNERAIFLFALYIIGCVAYGTMALCEYFGVWKLIEIPVLILVLAATLYFLDDAFDVATRRKNKKARLG